MMIDEIKEAIDVLERAQDDESMTSETYNEINEIILKLHNFID